MRAGPAGCRASCSPTRRGALTLHRVVCTRLRNEELPNGAEVLQAALSASFCTDHMRGVAEAHADVKSGAV